MGAIKRIAINTGGGDAPGLNAVIRAVTLSAIGKGYEVFGIKHGYAGLLKDDGIIPLNRNVVRGITHQGGTILGTTNRGNPFSYPLAKADGSVELVDVSDRVVQRFKQYGFDALISVGGDGSQRIAYKLYEKGIPTIGVPKTIDNDLAATVMTFGFDTAVNTAVEAIDKVHSTAQSHERVMVVELMGRYCGWIALNSGVAATADAILIPEIPFDLDRVCQKIMDRELRGRHFSIVVVAEGAFPKGGDAMSTTGSLGADRKLGGIGDWVAREISARVEKESRCVVLGHLQRGGSPTAFDRLLALRFGASAVRLVEQGAFGQMVALDPRRSSAFPSRKHRSVSRPFPWTAIRSLRPANWASAWETEVLAG